MSQNQIRRLLPAAAVIHSVALDQPQSGVNKIVKGPSWQEHNGIRIPGRICMPEPAVILQHRMEAACLQIAVNDAAVRLRLPGNRKKSQFALLLLRQGIPARLHNGKETVVPRSFPSFRRSSPPECGIHTPFPAFPGKLPGSPAPAGKNMLIIRRNQSAVIVQPLPSVSCTASPDANP